jgi:parallel beta-helix repeat protein
MKTLVFVLTLAMLASTSYALEVTAFHHKLTENLHLGPGESVTFVGRDHIFDCQDHVVFANDAPAIRIGGTDSIDVRNCYIDAFGIDYAAIEVSTSRGVFIHTTSILGGFDGIVFAQTTDSMIRQVGVRNAARHGVFINSGSDRVWIDLVQVYDVEESGIRVSFSNEATIINSWVGGASEGVLLESSNNNVVSGIEIFANLNTGVYLVNTAFNQILRNYIHHNQILGLFLGPNTTNQTIRDNYFCDNGNTHDRHIEGNQHPSNVIENNAFADTCF